jgi:hypothetical protein
MTTTSTLEEGVGPWIRRKTSRIKRLARFLVTASPSFLDATIPNRMVDASLGAMTSVKKRPCTRIPVLKAFWYSPLRLTRRAFPKRWEDIGDPSELPLRATRGVWLEPGGVRLRRNGQALAPLRAAALENQTALLRRHTHEKAVCALSAPSIGLERTLHDAGSPAINVE